MKILKSPKQQKHNPTKGIQYLQDRVPIFVCGERGIRTPGGVTLNGFQDRLIKPL